MGWPGLLKNQLDLLGKSTMMSLLSLCLGTQHPEPSDFWRKRDKQIIFQVPNFTLESWETHCFPITEIRYFSRR